MVSIALTAEPLPEFRHIALAVRAYVVREGVSLSDLSRRVGVQASSSHSWAKGTGGVGLSIRPKLAKLLGVPVSFLAPWDGKGEPPEAPDEVTDADGPETALGPARQARALVAREAPQVLLAPAAAPVLGGKLNYEGHGDGTATISVRARLPLSQAKPLFQLLLDSGIDMEGDTET